MIDLIIVGIGCLWLVYRAFVKKSEFPLFTALFIVLIRLPYFPFYLSKDLSFSLIAFVSSGFCLYKYFKLRDRMIIGFALTFLFFSAIFAINIWLK